MYQYPDYLMHYGVLGMKWGQRRAAKYAKKAAKAQKRGHMEDAKLYAKQSKRIESYHRKMGGSKTYNRVKKQNTLNLIGKSYALTTYGALKYEQAKAADKTTGRSIVEAVGGGLANNLTGGIVSVVEPRLDKSDKDLIKAAGKQGVSMAKKKYQSIKAKKAQNA